MSRTLTVNYENKPCYDIIIDNSFDGLAAAVEQIGKKGRKIAIITDTNVEPLYADDIAAKLSKISDKVIIHAISAGEENKNLENINKIYKILIENHFDRHDLIVALGGGVVGDMAGFAAATYLRGIAFVQIPTTLLSQTDSSIGGKTGVDYEGYKNMVGAFHMPSLVYINISTLKSLDGRQYASGFAEVMKHGLIKDQKFYEWLLDNIYEINDKEDDTLLEMIERSCLVKKAVVEKDPTEKGERMLLNFGHTLGHAIEKAKNFTLFHGECVALGAIAAAYISWKKEMISMEEYYEIRDMFVPFNLPISIEDIDPEEVIRLTKSDKKSDSDKVRFILLKAIGKAVVSMDVTDEEMRAALNEIIYVETND
ncbi:MULTISPECIES: 3-dehydroquinate synthase [unclassified Butyrivibrio]|uniref:3-dehydroquinate synthase n=1 Tax=unclassified Butyrivibrio TaxID=2639466 RepID=UPI0003B5B920|nr:MULTISPECIES: 3-dehydroquinate synthase [unclassified Butyrivibrio]MDC7295223.1 3-dehydroquinate synthase [Butyrivibrio sp. DSM 10294]